jgi:hypothetical protein
LISKLARQIGAIHARQFGERYGYAAKEFGGWFFSHAETVPQPAAVEKRYRGRATLERQRSI